MPLHSLSASNEDVADGLVCSSKGCAAQAQWGLRWNNPKIHTPERRKVWLACDEHREHLEKFLGLRGFLRDTVPVDQLEDEAPQS